MVNGPLTPIGAGRLLRASNECGAGQAAFHLIEQPIEGIWSCGPRPVCATSLIASTRSRRSLSAALSLRAASSRPRGVADEAADDSLHVRTRIADEGDQQPVRSGALEDAVAAAIGGWEREVHSLPTKVADRRAGRHTPSFAILIPLMSISREGRPLKRHALFARNHATTSAAFRSGGSTG